MASGTGRRRVHGTAHTGGVQRTITCCIIILIFIYLLEMVSAQTNFGNCLFCAHAPFAAPHRAPRPLCLCSVRPRRAGRGGRHSSHCPLHRSMVVVCSLRLAVPGTQAIAWPTRPHGNGPDPAGVTCGFQRDPMHHAWALCRCCFYGGWAVVVAVVATAVAAVVARITHTAAATCARPGPRGPARLTCTAGRATRAGPPSEWVTSYCVATARDLAGAAPGAVA